MEISLTVSVKRPVNSCVHWHDILIIESGDAVSVNNRQQILVILTEFLYFCL
jgi:hypothetical protein